MENILHLWEKPGNIPTTPEKVYKEDWVGYGDWLGNGNVWTGLKSYRAFDEARAFVKTLNIQNKENWRNYCDSGDKPVDIPSNPQSTYYRKGWSGFDDWLGTPTKNKLSTDKKTPRHRNYLEFVEAKAFVHGLNLKGVREWKEYCNSKEKPDNIPSYPHQTFSDKGWKGYKDWLGTHIKYI